MSRTYKDGPKDKRRPKRERPGRKRQIVVRGVRRDEPDLRRLSRALRELAMTQAETDAQATTPTEVSPLDVRDEPSDSPEVQG